MVRTPVLVATVVIAAVAVTIQPSAGSVARDLDLIIYPDGTVHVSSQMGVDPIDAGLELDLHGSAIDNFVAVGENGFLLDSEIPAGGTAAMIETFGSSAITVNYDIHDLVSKTGRVWTFSLDAPSDFALLLPKNAAIVGMTNVPISMELMGQQHQLILPAGATEVDYLLAPVPAIPPAGPEQAPPPDYLAYGMIGGMAAAVAAALMVAARARREKKAAVAAAAAPTRRRPQRAKESSRTAAAAPQKSTTPPTPDIEAVLGTKPDIRDDDRDIVRFISGNGGQALESELRKKFLQPRTTMWRAVKRLERHGLVEIEKRDMQNLVKLCGDAAAARGGGEGTQ